jgi:anhydro-N-acetylmuramic acid kinase
MWNMRRHDVKFGGQGAPLIPSYHRAIFGGCDFPGAVLNLGGVANLTYVEPTGQLTAFDHGTANALIDDWMSQKTSFDFDDGGMLANPKKQHGKR